MSAGTAGAAATLPRGPVMLDVGGLELTAEDCARLVHPLVGGVILFARNYATPLQLAALTRAIRELRSPQLLIAVDHEGGRVQRFRDGFSAIPPMRTLGAHWDRDVAAAHARLGAPDEALAWLARAHAAVWGNLAGLRADPAFASLLASADSETRLAAFRVPSPCTEELRARFERVRRRVAPHDT